MSKKLGTQREEKRTSTDLSGEGRVLIYAHLEVVRESSGHLLVGQHSRKGKLSVSSRVGQKKVTARP